MLVGAATNIRTMSCLVQSEMKGLSKYAENEMTASLKDTPLEVVTFEISLRPHIECLERQQIEWFGHLVRPKPVDLSLCAYRHRYCGHITRRNPRI